MKVNWDNPGERERVALYAGTGMTHEEIALVLEITVDELQRRYGEELRLGRHLTRGEIAKVIYDAAATGNQEAIDLLNELNAKNPELWPLAGAMSNR